MGLAKNGVQVMVNPAYAAMFGYAGPSEVAGRPLFDDIAPEERARLRKYARHRARGKPAPARYETRGIRRDGTIFDLAVAISTYRIKGEVYTVGILRDITDQKESERALRASEERARLLIETSMDAVLLTAPDGRILSANKAACKMFDRSEAELVRIGRAGVIDPSDPRVSAAVAERARTGQVNSELTFVRPDGTTFQGEVSSAVFRDSDNQERTSIVIRDLTERRQMEGQLEILRRAIDSHFDGAYWMDAENRFVYVNESACAMLGYPREELVGRSITLINPQATPEAMARVWQRLRTEHKFAGESVHRRKDGSEFPAEIAATYVRVGDREFNCGFARDISERKQAEAALRERESKYHALFEHMHSGFILLEVICDASGRAVDHRLLQANAEFEVQTGLKREAEVGRRSAELSFQWPEEITRQYYDIALRGGTLHDVRFNESLGRHYDVRVYSPSRGQFAVLFNDISEQVRAEGNLRLFRELIERSSDAIEVFEPATGRILDVNQTACRMLGYTRDELLSLTVFDLDQGLDRATYELRTEQLNRAGALTFETRHRRKDGEILPVEVSISRVQLNRDYRVASVRDITDRKRVEEALRQEQALFAGLAATIPDYIYFKDRQSRFVRGNESLARRFGLRSPEEAVGKTDSDFFTGEHARQAFEDEQRIMRSGEPLVGIEEKETWPDGRVTWVSTTKVPLRNSAGEVTGLVGISRDITEHRLAVERVREQAAMLDQASDAIYLTAMDCTVLYWNAAAERIYGWSAAEALRRRTPDLISADESQGVDLVSLVLQSGEWTGERRQKNKAGRELAILSRLTLLRDDQGRPKSILVINTDITEKKALEARFLRAQRLESIGALASGIAHDLNNVLAPIVMGATLLRQTAQDSTAQNLLAMMEKSAQRGADIVRQVLTFARGSGGQRVAVEPRHLVREMVKLADETFPKTIRVEEELPSDVWLIDADVTQVHQALMNLCVNARDAMPDGGCLTIGVENVAIDATAAAQTPGAMAGRYVRFRIADTGTGIAPEDQDRIFEPFFSTKGPGKGTGLGLSTVLGIIKGHGGFVRVDSAPGRGTTFELYFPAAASARAPDRSTPPFPLPADRRAGGELVLVVDD